MRGRVHMRCDLLTLWSRLMRGCVHLRRDLLRLWSRAARLGSTGVAVAITLVPSFAIPTPESQTWSVTRVVIARIPIARIAIVTRISIGRVVSGLPRTVASAAGQEKTAQQY